MKKLLHIIPYSDFVPPRNGGALRCYHLAKELSRYFELTILTLQPKETISVSLFHNVRIINPEKQIEFSGFKSRIKNAVVYRLMMHTITGPAEATVLQFHPALLKLLKHEHFDVVICEHLHSVLLGKLIRRIAPSTMRIIDQHNVDHLLYQQNYALKTPGEKKEFRRLKHMETHLFRYADLFITCSVKDRDTFAVLNRGKIKGFVVPNGTDLRDIDIDKKDYSKKSIIFCGSLDYSPNRNGVLWFYNTVWPELKKSIPGIIWTLIGRNGDEKTYHFMTKDDQVNFVGEVGDVEPYYRNASIAIAPLFEGSGTRLKILEAMSMGNPVISTHKGAEGIDYINNQNILIADDIEGFINSIKELFNDNNKSQCLANEAKKLISAKYSWKIIVKELSDNVLNIIKY